MVKISATVKLSSALLNIATNINIAVITETNLNYLNKDICHNDVNLNVAVVTEINLNYTGTEICNS